MITQALITNEIQSVCLCFGLYCLLQNVSNIASIKLRYFHAILLSYIQKEVTTQMLAKIEKLKMISFDDSANYDIINKINSESHQLQNILNSLLTIFSACISLVGIAVLMISQYNIIMILVFFAFIPTFLTEIQISKKMHSLFVGRLEKLRLIQALRDLMLKYDNIKEIKIYRTSRYIADLIKNIYNQNIQEDKIIRKNTSNKQVFISVLETFIGMALKIYVLIIGIKRTYSIGIITMGLNSVDILMNTTRGLILTLSAMVDDNLYITSLLDFLNKDFTVQESDRGTTFNGRFSSIELRGVSFRYPNSVENTLENINLEFKNTKSYLIVGENGAGKTTLIKLLSSIYDPTEGAIYIDEHPLSTYNIESFREKLVVVFQDFIRYPLSAGENIKLGNYKEIHNNDKMIGAAKKTHASNFIEILPKKYSTILQNEWVEGTGLSFGQWQKIAISRAYFSNVPIMIMDEPGSALDAYAENILCEEIASIMKKRTTIMIFHRYTTAKMVDEIIVIGNKTVLERGSFYELMKKGGQFAEMFTLQAQKYGME